MLSRTHTSFSKLQAGFLKHYDVTTPSNKTSLDAGLTVIYEPYRNPTRERTTSGEKTTTTTKKRKNKTESNQHLMSTTVINKGERGCYKLGIFRSLVWHQSDQKLHAEHL